MVFCNRGRLAKRMAAPRLIPDGAGQSPGANAGGSGTLRYMSQFVEAGAGGHDIIDQGDLVPGEVDIAGKGSAQVLASRRQGQLDLRQCVAYPVAGIGQHRDIKDVT